MLRRLRLAQALLAANEVEDGRALIVAVGAKASALGLDRLAAEARGAAVAGNG
jgi:hypothetical protein